MRVCRIAFFLVILILSVPGAWAQGISKVRASYDSGDAAAGIFGFGFAAQYSMTFDLGDPSLGHFMAVGYFAELEYVAFGGSSVFGAAGGVEFLGLWILNAQTGLGYINTGDTGQLGFFLRGLLEIPLPMNILVHLGASIDVPMSGEMRVGIRVGGGYQF